MNLVSADSVMLEGLVFEAMVGVYDWEHHIKQKVELDIELHTSTLQAGQTDDLAYAVDYTAVMQIVKTLLATRRFKLLEALLEVLAQQLLALKNVSAVTLVAAKPAANALARTTKVRIYRSVGV